MNDTKTTRLLVLGLLGFILALVLIYLVTSPMGIEQKYRPITELGGPFTLHSAKGDFSLSDIQGKVGVLYFGFLSCKEACPDSIGVYLSALRRLEEHERDKVQFLFISVDPERDNLQELAEFDAFYEDKLISITGTKPQIEALTEQYGVYFDLVDLEGSAMQYTVDHSSRFYMVDPTGKLITAMSHSTTPNELAAQIRQLMPI